MQRWEPSSSAACTRGGLLVLLCASALGGCGSAGARDEGPTDGIVVWEGSKEQWVRLERRDDAGSPVNDHPAQLSAAEISGALASLRVVDDEEEPAEPIFTPQEASVLGEAVARGLAQAAPDQDVTFRSVGSRRLTSGKALKGVSVNSGRVFEQAGKLNLILGDVRAKAKTKAVYGQWDEDFSKPRPAARSANPEHDWKVVPPQGVEQHAGRDDWLVFDNALLAALSAPADAPAAAAVAPATSTAPTSAAAPPQPATAVPSPPAVQTAPAAASSPEADMERRLRTLKDLHEKGLITEEAYRAKVEEILSVL